MQWYSFHQADRTDSPALLIYKDRVQQNILRAIAMVKDPAKLRPHVKTNKMAEVCALMMDAGINKFKCATIAEAEMLGMTGAKDVLLAYQPVGPKADRFLQLVKRYPETSYSCVLDNAEAAKHLSDVFHSGNITLRVFIDLNNGMNRTGIIFSNALNLFETLVTLPALKIGGVHVYDGHIRETDLAVRQAHSDAGIEGISSIIAAMEERLKYPLVVVAGGSPTFPTHASRDVEASPGTFVFWDWGYKHLLPDEPFEYAALVLTRVISIVDDTHITTDLGNKSVASENPLQKRVHYLNAPDAEPVGHSEEHMVLKVEDSSKYKPGDILYGVPVHICPTVALYEKAVVIEAHDVVGHWKVIARDRTIHV